MTFTTMFETKWKTVRCDHCGVEFAYRQDEHSHPVSCPCCGFFQASMVKAAKREAFGFFTVLAVLATVFGVVIAVLSAGEAAAVVPFALAAVALFVTGHFKMARFDPNSQASSRAGLRTHGCVMLREEYELLQSMARRQEPALFGLDHVVLGGTGAFAH